MAELLEEQFHGWEAVAAAFDSSVVLGSLLPGRLVVGDRLRLAQAISNLIANALEHGPWPDRTDERPLAGPQHVRIEVDRRRAPACRKPLTELTRRARAAGAARRGRGLAIAAQIAERHRGRLVAAPPAPRGTRIESRAAAGTARRRREPSPACASARRPRARPRRAGGVQRRRARGGARAPRRRARQRRRRARADRRR